MGNHIFCTLTFQSKDCVDDESLITRSEATYSPSLHLQLEKILYSEPLVVLTEFCWAIMLIKSQQCRHPSTFISCFYYMIPAKKTYLLRRIVFFEWRVTFTRVEFKIKPFILQNPRYVRLGKSPCRKPTHPGKVIKLCYIAFPSTLCNIFIASYFRLCCSPLKTK